MKRLIAILLAVLLLAGLAACSDKEKGGKEAAVEKVTMEKLVGTWKTEVRFDADFVTSVWNQRYDADAQAHDLSEEERSILHEAAKQAGDLKVSVPVDMIFREDGTYVCAVSEDRDEAMNQLAEQEMNWILAWHPTAMAQIKALLAQKEPSAKNPEQNGRDFYEWFTARTTLFASMRSLNISDMVERSFEIRDGKVYCLVYEFPTDNRYCVFVMRDGKLCFDHYEGKGNLDGAKLTVLQAENLVCFQTTRGGVRKDVFQTDDVWNKKSNNNRTYYEYSVYEKLGYLDLVDYSPVEDELSNAETVWENESVKSFQEKYEALGYEIVYLAPITFNNGRPKTGGEPFMFAVKDYGVGPWPADYSYLYPYSYTKAE